MALIGRDKERRLLLEAAKSDKPELVAVIGRRRVGKTFLVNQTFGGQFAFHHNGLSPAELKRMQGEEKNKTLLQLQLRHFQQSLREYGLLDAKLPKDWFEAFHMLSALLKGQPQDRKSVVFIDELPWLDTDKSFFLTAFEAFCNGFAARENLCLIVAGSATSWIYRNLVDNHGGLYGRVSKEIVLEPFDLNETEQFLLSKGIPYSRYDIARTYMVFGGIPFYLDYLSSQYTLAENVDNLFFGRGGALRNEFDRLFLSSFDNAKLSSAIVRALAKKSIGLTRNEILQNLGYGDGETFSDALKALIVSGFVVKYAPIQEGRKTQFYKLIDPFCLFYLRFVENYDSLDGHFFADNDASGSLRAWKGIAFENLCYNHLDQIKAALRIGGVAMARFAFVHHEEGGKGAQIDLVLERKDNVVDLCEMKFYAGEYEATAADELDLERKKTALRKYLKKSQSIQTVLISSFGLGQTRYRGLYQRVIVLDDLFTPSF